MPECPFSQNPQNPLLTQAWHLHLDTKLLELTKNSQNTRSLNINILLLQLQIMNT